MKRTFKAVSAAIFSLVFFSLAFPVAGYGSEDVPRISTGELEDMLGAPGLAVLDARTVKDWRKSKAKIKGAVRVDPHDVSSWAANYQKDQKIVLYCA